MTLLRHARLVRLDGVGTGWIRVEGQRIAAIGTDHQPEPPADTREQELDLTGYTVVPGFVDIHVHGGGGASYHEGDPAQARRSLAFHREHGTTTTLASTVTASLDDLERQIDTLTGLVEDGEIAGIHLEGPFVSLARCGAHNPSLLRPPRPDEVRRLLAAGQGTVRMVTLAPELEYGLEAVELLASEGVIPAIGHTDATYVQAKAAIARGARVATHLFNGMRGLHHREPGPVGAALENDDVVLEVVNDGIHVHASVIRMVLGDAGADRVALITDAMSAAGASDGLYPLGSLMVRVEDGVAKLADGDALAGSTLTMASAFRRAVLDVGVSLDEASRATSLTPARAIGLDDQVGSLCVGKSADLVVLDDDLRVVSVMRAGAWIGAAPAGRTAHDAPAVTAGSSSAGSGAATGLPE